MVRQIQSLYALNRGVVSRLGLARLDVKRIALAAEIQQNFLPRVLGSMMLRPGRRLLGATYLNAATRFVKFIFATTDTALLELTANQMRVWISDVLLTRPAVTTTITNGTFNVNLTGWTDLDEAGTASTWAAPGYMQLAGSGSNYAIREQQVTVAGANIGVEHGIRIVIARGPVSIRIGSGSGDEDYLKESVLYAGTHSISIVPTGNFYIRFFSRQVPVVWVDSCTIEAAGAVVIPTPWGASDLNNIRTDQSADVVFVACANYQQRRIERRGTHPNARSWSVALYAPVDGPFRVQNVSSTTLTVNATTGNITVTASTALFRPNHVGALFSISSVGQFVTTTTAVAGTATASIRVTGIDTQRVFTTTITGIATAGTEVRLQRSYDNLTWTDNSSSTHYATNGTVSQDDSAPNQIIYYRLILFTVAGGDNVTMQLAIGSGSIRGVVRITDFTSTLSVGAEVVVALGGTDATAVWQEGQWSDLRGWPTSGKFHEGRLWWFGQNGVWGSVSDAFDSFDETFPGNAAPINRTIGSGPVDTINWGLSLKGLMIGAQGAEFSVRASSLDEPLTPTNFNCKGSTTQGSGAIEAVKIDQAGYFVNRSSTKVYDLSFDVRSYDYGSSDLMALAPEIGRPGIVRMDVQRQPDTRLHCVRSDGTAIVAVIDKNEDVLAWYTVTTTNGTIEDVVTLPALSGDLDDQVYYVVKRTINGSTVRYLEKWAQEIDCRGDKSYCYLADSFIEYNGAAATVITGLSALEGQQVVVWADGADVGTDESTSPWSQRYTVSGGQITLATAASRVVVGLPYTAQFQSAKLGFQTQVGSPLNMQKKIGHIGLILADTYPKGLKFGPSFDVLDDMPGIEQGRDVGSATVTDYDENLIEFPGTWTTDLRICLQAQAPRPCTVLAVTPDMSERP
ncbi:MAG TPA: hypothetical protein VIO33_02585 [Burkholderiaceae bacterium]